LFTQVATTIWQFCAFFAALKCAKMRFYAEAWQHAPAAIRLSPHCKRQHVMTSIAHDLAKILPTIRSHGEFYATGTSDISIPNVEIDSVGRISLPLLAAQAEQLIAIATQSPYGRGEETIIDDNVRKTWQIASEAVHLSGRNWPKTLEEIVAQAAAGLGVEEAISAELYKLLIYDTGSFFVEHRDTEKVAGMFATLVVVLPSVCSGGRIGRSPPRPRSLPRPESFGADRRVVCRLLRRLRA
jgi:hypothetical protein